MSHFSFRLPSDFLDSYKDRKVDWGYTDAGGNSLAEITFLRTYSRIKDDGTKERWWEVCQRVIEGMFSIQRDHCKANRLPWRYDKAQRTAQDAYERMFTFKWLPPGRGLWMMGTPLIMEQKNSAALQNCFAGETEIITSDGIKRIDSLAGSSVSILSAGGKWIEAPIRSFGSQRLSKVTLCRAGNSKTIYATADHRWFVKDKRNLRDSNVFHEVTTKELKNTHRMQEVFGQGVKDITPSPIGVAHGFTYGDGRASIGYRNSNSVTLFGDKDKALARYFEGHPSRIDREGLEFSSLPNFFKEIPSIKENKSYLYGWLSGYFAADGTVDRAGSVCLASHNLEALNSVASIAATIGIGVYEIRSEEVISNLDAKQYTSYKLSFIQETLPDEFFVINEHRQRVIEKRHKSRPHWNVVSVEETDRIEEVYCATVPDTGAFTLAGNILTGNCAFISTEDMTRQDPAGPFTFMMEALMLGIGVGFDTLGGKKKFSIYEPGDQTDVYLVPDTREGWAQSLRLLLESYLMPGKNKLELDIQLVRPAGAPIKIFGGVAAGPGPLVDLHRKVHQLMRERLDGKKNSFLDTELIADIGNLIGVCVVSGNVRRSAELMMGDIADPVFKNLKNPVLFPERNNYDPDLEPGWGYMSNNSISAEVGQDISAIVDDIALNGEPGVIWMDVSRKYGRLIDPPNNKDHRAKGYNPCAEQTLESGECCTLVEMFMNRHSDMRDFQQTAKVAFLYAKTVTLMPTHWEKTNAIMQRNRRIGCSVSGVADFTDNHNMTVLREWLNSTYDVVQKYDQVYSEWLCVRESIKTTTVKPSGTVSILAGASPGAHWGPGGEYFNRAVRFRKDDAMIAVFAQSGYRIEDDVTDPDNTSVVYFPVHSGAKRAQQDVSLFEKANLAVLLQRYWSDNSVSVTLSFNPETEAEHIGTILHMHEGQLKTVSFLPTGNTVYPQMPYTEITAQDFEDASFELLRADLEPVYLGLGKAAIGEQYCTTDACEVKEVKLNSV